MIATINFLEKNFKKFNRDYFCSMLPMPSFILINSRQILGQCGAKNWKSNHPNYTIKISNYFERTEHQFLNTLLHEMIHLYFQSNGNWSEGHGNKWQNMARSFDRYGWDIQTKEYNVNSLCARHKTQRTIMTFVENSNNKRWVCCVSNDTSKMKSFSDYINENNHYREPKFYHSVSDKFVLFIICQQRIRGKVMTEQTFKQEYLPLLTEFEY